MNKQEFQSAIGPALRYWQRELDPEVADIYFDNLKDYRVDSLKRAILQCIKEDKYFPRLADLLPKLGANVRKEAITSNAELLRLNECCIKMLTQDKFGIEFRLEEGGTLRYPIEPIVDAAKRAYQDDIDNHGTPKWLAESRAISYMWLINVKRFQRDVGKTWRPTRPTYEPDNSGPRTGMQHVGATLETNDF